MSLWKSPPKTFSAALKRLEVVESKLRWAEEDRRSAFDWGRENALEAARLARLLTYRAKVGDATARCSHAHTEIGKLSGNTYCSDCQEILIDLAAPPDDSVGRADDSGLPAQSAGSVADDRADLTDEDVRS